MIKIIRASLLLHVQLCNEKKKRLRMPLKILIIEVRGRQHF